MSDENDRLSPIGGEGEAFIIIGGGPAAASAARVLALSEALPRVLVVSAEDRPPYDRTTLSKLTLLSDRLLSPPLLWQHSEEWTSRVGVRLNTEIVHIDTESREVVAHSGERFRFSKLLVATGAKPRRLSIPGSDGPGVHYLRDARDAEGIRHGLESAHHAVVIGGGVIGLELAAVTRALAIGVTVVETGERILGRGVPTSVALFIEKLHIDHGVGFRIAQSPTEIIRNADGVVEGVRLSSGELIEADIVIVGIGIIPCDQLAIDAGIEVDDGIVVDSSGRTSTPHVYAAGDVARIRPSSHQRGTRLEIWKAAGQFGEVAAHSMLGETALFDEVIWTWSEQYDFMLQSTGISLGATHEVNCKADDGSWVVTFSFSGTQLVAACGVAQGAQIARVIRSAQLAIAANSCPSVNSIESSANDLKLLVNTLLASMRAPRWRMAI